MAYGIDTDSARKDTDVDHDANADASDSDTYSVSDHCSDSCSDSGVYADACTQCSGSRVANAVPSYDGAYGDWVDERSLSVNGKTMNLAALILAQVCHVVSATSTMLPAGTGTIPPPADIVDGGGYHNLLTQWGVARGNGPYFLRQVGGPPVAAPGGVVPVRCDCFQGWDTMAVAADAAGHTRVIGQWKPGGGVPPQPTPQPIRFSGLRAQLVQASGAPSSFGQQIDLPNSVPLGSRVAAIYMPSTGKFFGYFPVNSGGVYLADLTTPTGNASPYAPIKTTLAINWLSTGGQGVRLAAGYGWLVGVTTNDLKLHMATLNPATGMPVIEFGGGPVFGVPVYLALAPSDDGTFILSAGGNSGLSIYDLTPRGVDVVAVIPGQIHRAILRDRVLFTLRSDPVTALSFIDVRSIDRVLAGDNSIALSVPHKGAPDASYVGLGFEAAVNGSAAWLYRIVATSPEASVRTTTLDLSCLQGGGTPTWTATTVPVTGTRTLTPPISMTQTVRPTSVTPEWTATPFPRSPTSSPTIRCDSIVGAPTCTNTPTRVRTSSPAATRSPSPQRTLTALPTSSPSPRPSVTAPTARTVVTLPNTPMPPITVERPTMIPTTIVPTVGTPSTTPTAIPTSGGWTILPSWCDTAPKPTPRPQP